jgi:hypothetical protein
MSKHAVSNARKSSDKLDMLRMRIRARLSPTMGAVFAPMGRPAMDVAVRFAATRK